MRKDNVVRLTGLTLLIVTSVAVAEPKQLVCSYNDADLIASEESSLFDGDGKVQTAYLPIGRQIASASYFCREWANSSANYCDKLLKLREFKSECLKTPEIPRYTFTFDTNDLTTGNDVNAEFSADGCGETFKNESNDSWVTKYSKSDVEKVGLTATPSFISFSNAGTKLLVFNVDRKTLTAGYGTNRFFQCEVRDVDTSQNAI